MDESPGKRTYDNTRRAEKAAGTRSAILRALGEQLVSRDSPDFSVAEAATSAGVTVRTVYRHFPTKEEMRAGVAEWVLGITRRVRIPETPNELPDTAHDTYAMFEKNAPLIRALLLSEIGRGIRAGQIERRRRGLAKALAPALRELAPSDAQTVKALFAHLLSAEAWWQLRESHGVSGRSAGRIVAWVSGLVLDALADGSRPTASET